MIMTDVLFKNNCYERLPNYYIHKILYEELFKYIIIYIHWSILYSPITVLKCNLLFFLLRFPLFFLYLYVIP